MNTYEIKYQFNTGPVMTSIQVQPTRDKARRALFAQIGMTRLLDIISIEKVEA